MLEDVSFFSLKTGTYMEQPYSSLWSYVSRHHVVKEGKFPSFDLKILHMLNAYIVRFSVTTAFFFPIYAGLLMLF